ncbi:MAG: hypothetical protein HZC16_00500, partial [Candidatus Omnitrophica bacterium]|nr:hypothetical protein [Candidatus Omnitrophota bacterium]
MNPLKTKSLESIEQKMEGLEEGGLRYQILQSAKNFKTSWVELGRALYAAWKDKLYKEWGFGNFDIYASREIGIRKNTAMKLLRSYYFLEKEEPVYLTDEYKAASNAATMPTYESIDVLRLARNKKDVGEEDYARLKKDIFEKGKDVREAKRDLTSLIRQRQELEPEEAWEKRKIATVRRFLGTLKALKEEIEAAKLLPAPLIKEAAALIRKLEAE